MNIMSDDFEMRQRYLDLIVKPLMVARGISEQEAIRLTYYKSWCPRCEDFFDVSHDCFGKN